VRGDCGRPHVPRRRTVLTPSRHTAAHFSGVAGNFRQSVAGMLTRPAGHEAKAEAEARKSEAEDEAQNSFRGRGCLVKFLH